MDLSPSVIRRIERILDSEDLILELVESGCMLEHDLFGTEHSGYPWTFPSDMPNYAGRLGYRLIKSEPYSQ